MPNMNDIADTFGKVDVIAKQHGEVSDLLHSQIEAYVAEYGIAGILRLVRAGMIWPYGDRIYGYLYRIIPVADAGRVENPGWQAILNSEGITVDNGICYDNGRAVEKLPQRL